MLMNVDDPENSEDILCKLCIEKERPLAGCYAKANDKVAENDDTDSSIEPYIAAISRKPRANDEMAMDVDSIQPEDIIIEPEDSIAPIPRKPHAKRSSSGSRRLQRPAKLREESIICGNPGVQEGVPSIQISVNTCQRTSSSVSQLLHHCVGPKRSIGLVPVVTNRGTSFSLASRA